MGYTMKGSPAKLGTIQGTAGHRSALKMKESALKHSDENKGAIPGHAHPHKEDKGKEIKVIKKEDKVVTGGTKTWKEGVKASGNRLNELEKASGKYKKGTSEYAALQPQINKALGSKKVHPVKGSPKGTKQTVITDDKGTTKKSDDTTTTEHRVKGVERKGGKTLTFAQKEAEKVKIAKEKADIKKAKKSGDKAEKAQSQKEISEIKSGRDDAKTGTAVSRWWHKGRAKRKAKEEDKLKEKAKNA